ncbi:hypothetical protein H1R20_g761, partial [Candolleomyces eurysporus]
MMATRTKLSTLSRQVLTSSPRRFSVPQILSPRRSLSSRVQLSYPSCRPQLQVGHSQRCPTSPRGRRHFGASSTSRGATALAFAEEEPVEEIEVDQGTLPASKLRNIAIIAHVDHGKTTLVDQLLRQSGTLKPNTDQNSAASTDGDSEFGQRVMDSNDLERERGITILSKCTSIDYNGTNINIVDTPGHADFGGEVERVLNMVDGVALVVDATDGPMTQTRFVLGKALARGLRSRATSSTSSLPSAQPTNRPNTLFSTHPQNKAGPQPKDPVPPGQAIAPGADMTPLFDLILSHVPPPSHLNRSKPFSMLTVQIESDPYVGVLYLGRVQSGVLRVNDVLWALDAQGNKVGEGKVKKIFGRRGLERTEKDAAGAGEIVSIAGIKMGSGGVNVTLVHPEGWGEEGPVALPTTPIDPPTISVVVYPNDSPLAGQEGSKLTSQLIRDRIYKEAETNVALTVLPGPTSESLELRGRAVLVPNPEVPGQMLEPVEECTVMVKEEYAGGVVQKLTMRKGEMVSYEADEAQEGWVRIVMDVPARGLIGYMAGEFKNDVHGQGTINHIFKGYEPYRGAMDTGRNGALISMANGESSGYAMMPLQARGAMFIHPQIQVYPGMVIGESSKSQDLYLNPCVKKQLTNIRAAGADEKIVLASPKIMTLEESLAYMADDEIVEVTPKNVRLRKLILDVNKRMRMKK